MALCHEPTPKQDVNSSRMCRAWIQKATGHMPGFVDRASQAGCEEDAKRARLTTYERQWRGCLEWWGALKCAHECCIHLRKHGGHGEGMQPPAEPDPCCWPHTSVASGSAKIRQQGRRAVDIVVSICTEDVEWIGQLAFTHPRVPIDRVRLLWTFTGMLHITVLPVSPPARLTRCCWVSRFLRTVSAPAAASRRDAQP